MKNFIEIATRDGKETINVNHIYRVSPYSGNNYDPDLCIIYFNAFNPSGVTIIGSIESYDDIISKINEAI